MKKLTIIAAVVGLLCTETRAQDIHFSQFTETPMLVNPASAGFFHGYHRFLLNHKSQWASIGSPYRTIAASFDMPFYFGYEDDAYMGAGVMFYNDLAGDSRFGINKGALNFSGVVPMDDRNKLSAGLQIGFAQRKGTIDGLLWGNQFTGEGFNTNIAPNEVSTLTSFAYADIGMGVMYEFDNLDENLDGYDEIMIRAGAAVHHVNRPELRYTNTPTDQIPRKFMFDLLVRYDIPGSYVSFIPRGMYVSQGPHREIYGGAMLRVELKSGTKITGLTHSNAISFGAQARIGDAITPMMMLDLSGWSFGFAYDISVGGVGTVKPLAGGYEITLRYVNLLDALWSHKAKG